MNARPLLRWLPLALLTFSLGAAVLRSGVVARDNAAAAQERLDALAERVAHWTEESVRRFEYGLRGARGAIIGAGGEAIRHATFLEYARSREHEREFPGSRGYGFIRRVPASAVPAYLAEMRQARPDYRIRELGPNPGERFVIEMIEPLERNREAVGLDIASEAKRRAAAQESMRSGLPILTAPITLIQAAEHPGQGFLLMLPVYRIGTDPKEGVEREHATLGWTYTPLMIDDILQNADWRDPQFRIRLADVTRADQPITIFSDRDFVNAEAQPLSSLRVVELFHRRWELDVQATPEFMAALNLREPASEGLAIAFAGVLLSLLLYIWLDRRGRAQLAALQQARLAAIVEGSDSAIIGQTLDGTVSSWNAAAVRLFGFREEEALGRRLGDLILPAELAEEYARSRQSVAAGHSVTHQATQRRHRSGSRLDVQVIVSPIRDDRGVVVGASSTFRDISRQLAMENSFRELLNLSSTHLGSVFLDRAVEALSRLLKADLVFVARKSDAAPKLDVLTAFSPTGKAESWSSELADTPCALLYEASGQGLQDFVAPDGSLVITSGVRKRFGLLRGAVYEGFMGLPLRHPDGRIVGHVAAFFVEPVAEAQRDPLLDIGQLFAHRIEAELYRLQLEAQRDRVVEELRRLNESLEAEVASRTAVIRQVSVLQKAILDNAGYSVIATDEQGAITVFNPAAEAMLGYRAAEVLGGTLERFHDPVQMQSCAQELSQNLGYTVAAGFQSFATKARLGIWGEREWTYVHKDGRRFPVLLNVSALRDTSGQIIGFLGMAIDLSERKRLERALTAERDRFRTMIESAPSAILTICEDGRIETVNGRAEEVFGYRREELEGQPIDLLIAPDLREQHGVQQRSYVATGANSRLMSGRVVHARHRKGHDVPVEVRLSRFHGEDGVKVIAIATDRSEQQLLADSEARWRTMASSLPQLVWTCSADGACDFLSHQWTEYTGVPEEVQLGVGWVEQVHPDDRAVLLRQWQDAVRAGDEFQVEFRIRRHDGQYRWFDTRAVPLKDSQNRVVKWIGSNTDIEDRRQAEAEVRDLNAHLEARIEERTRMLDAARRDLQNILDALPSMVGYWDSSLRNRFANHAYRAWFGQDHTHIPGKHMAEVFGPELYSASLPSVQAALRGQRQRFEREIRAADGSVRHALAEYVPDVVDGEVRGFYALAHDITEVRLAQAAAEAASAAKSLFLANMSHEIRTPMNAVLGMLQLLTRTPLDRAQRDFVSKAGAAGRTLLGLLNDVLDFSKIEAGKLVLDPHPFQLDSLMRELGMLMAASRGGKPIELLFDIATDLPRQLSGDVLRIKQILINLAGNALKFTDAGEVVVAVSCGEPREGRVLLQFTVRDTGIGMTADQCQRVFEGFSQAEAATTRRFGGTGLGLAISRRLAEMMGGRLWAQSEPGRGSAFHFSVELECGPAHRDLPPAGMERRLAGLRVLLAMGHDSSRRVMERMLRGFGWTVQSCADESQARALLTGGGAPAVDLVLLDWPAQQADLVDQLRQTPGLSLIGLSNSLDAAAPGVEPASLPTLLVKPLTASMLFDAVAEARLGTRPEPGAPNLLPFRRSKRLKGLRVLVVEDNAINQLVAQGLLSSEGAEVSPASTGAAGVEAVRGAQPAFDIVLMDIQMPDMDGYAATRLIRALPQAAQLPIVAMTANAMNSDREASLQAGMNDHVAKPFELERLVSVILQHCRPEAAAQDAADAIDPVTAGGDGTPALVEVPAALARMGGDMEIYREVLASFLRDVPVMMQGLMAAGPEPDLPGRQRLAHTLKGLAGTLGAAPLKAAALQAEQILRSQGLEAFRERALLPLIEVLDETVEALRKLQGPAQQAPAAASQPVAGRPLEESLDQLAELLRTSSGRALSVFSDLWRRHAQHDPQRFAAMQEAMDALDFAEAERLCRELREQCAVAAAAVDDVSSGNG